MIIIVLYFYWCTLHPSFFKFSHLLTIQVLLEIVFRPLQSQKCSKLMAWFPLRSSFPMSNSTNTILKILVPIFLSENKLFKRVISALLNKIVYYSILHCSFTQHISFLATLVLQLVTPETIHCFTLLPGPFANLGPTWNFECPQFSVQIFPLPNSKWLQWQQNRFPKCIKEMDPYSKAI